MTELRVFQLAKELGIKKQKLVSRINNELELGFKVDNPMAFLNPAEAIAIRSAVTGEAPKKVAPPKKKKTRKKKKVEEKPVEENIVVAAPIRRRRKVVFDEGGKVESEEIQLVNQPEGQESEFPAEDAKEEPVANDDFLAPIKKKTPVRLNPNEIFASLNAKPKHEEIAEPAKSIDAPVKEKKPDEKSVEKSGENPVESKTSKSDSREAVEKKPESEKPKASPKAKEGAAPNKKPEVKVTPAKIVSRPKETKPVKRGAQVVGTINQSVLLDRLAADGKDFSPGPKRQSPQNTNNNRNKRNDSSKRVVEGRDLYDAKSRRNRRRNARNAKKTIKKTEITLAAEHKRNIRIEDAITVGELAKQMGAKSGAVAMNLIAMGMMATVNTMLDFETASIIAEEFGYTVENVAFDIEKFYDTDLDPEETLKPRPPVVTVMGHVDHGKTSLLDAIRSSDIAVGEAGGVTQHIGAYMVHTTAGDITFLDTPGHEAFTALRARGAKATDIVVLVVAADDGVMPQTVEAIMHAKDAEVPIIVAVNKIDKDGANVERIKQAMTEYELIPEEWGGDTLFIEVSALKKTNIQGVIDAITLQAEISELKANPERDAQGIVIESELDTGRGPVATILVQRGTLKQGDIVVSGAHYGRARVITNDRGGKISDVKPSTPVEITGLSGVPEAGEPFFVVTDEKEAKRVTSNVQNQRKKEQMASLAKSGSVSLEELSALIKEGEIKELKVIVKAGVQGSVEALKDAFSKLGNEEVKVKVIHSAVGGITESDVSLAASGEGAVIIGFNVRANSKAMQVAEKYGVRILTYSIIYDAIEQIHALLEGLLSPFVEEEVIGRAEVRDVFVAPRIGTIAGCYILDGLARRGAKARLIRDDIVIYSSEIASLRRFKDDVKEVKTGYECGMGIENYNDVRVGDIIEIYDFIEVAATL